MAARHGRPRPNNLFTSFGFTRTRQQNEEQVVNEPVPPVVAASDNAGRADDIAPAEYRAVWENEVEQQSNLGVTELGDQDPMTVP
jgi:hypothetical protein